MSLGQLYSPKGKALETAQQVLEIENPYACNVAMGCSNKCKYCYGDTSNRRWYNIKGIRLPKTPPVELVKEQIKKGLRPEGVFLSFMTDPFIKETKKYSEDLIDLLAGNTKIATLSKQSAYFGIEARTGMTIVSNNKFSKKFEPNAKPVTERINLLKKLHDGGCYTWVSMEPYPTPAIWEQDIIDVLEQIKFVDFIIFGKWNYSSLSNDKDFYKKTVKQFEDYCIKHKIRYWVKSDTRRFINA